MALTGFKFKQEQQAAAVLAKKEADAAEKTRKDREYDLRRAQETAAITATAVDGRVACETAAAETRETAVRLQAEQTGLVKDALRKKKQETRAAEEKAKLLGSLAAMDDPGRASAIEAAQLAVTTAQANLDNATGEATRLAEAATATDAAAKAVPDMSPSWTKDHSAAASSRVLEADLRNMKADLTKLGANAPPGAVHYCSLLEDKIDHDAHHVPCPRCGTEHGIDRTAPAKDAVAEQVRELERLATLPDDAVLTEQQQLDRSIGKDLQSLRTGGRGKMIGVLLCQDSEGRPVALRAFSGDSAGRDDVDGWCPHIPPNSSMKSANGVEVPMSALPATDGTPHGVCAAPKMIQEAHRRGLTIVGIAEAWYGGGNVQPHGALVASCTTCKKNLDVQLCNAYPSGV